MKCHYEVLSVARDANSDEIKKAYKKLAIKWHPDKNLDNTEAATEQFQLIQQAFEVLSDPHERTWYDDHRDAILKGKCKDEYEKDCLDVYKYFTASCYKGFGDDEKGFYSVYQEVFNKIAAEDAEYYTDDDDDDDSDIEIPNFGKSDTPFEEVKAFYAHWQSYCTKKSYSWLDPFDARTAGNRKISRLIEKENKKVRDKAKKARNEEVRELVGFVRKRDKRVQAHAQLMQKLNTEKANKTEEKRLEKIKQRKEELQSHQESEWSKFSNLETELKNIEASLASEFGESSLDESEEEIIDDHLYCVACNKLFKTSKAFENHESSKKHKENIIVLKQSMLEGSEPEEDSDESTEEGEVLSEYNGEVSDLEDDPLFCDPCGKQFKTCEAIENHKKTKKHIDNYKMFNDTMYDIEEEESCTESIRNLPHFDVNSEPPILFRPFLKGGPENDKKYNGNEIANELCRQIDEFTQDSDIIKTDVDKLCKQLDGLFETADAEELDEPVDVMSTKFTDEYMAHCKSESKALEELLNSTKTSNEDKDFFIEGKKKQKKKQKSKQVEFNSKTQKVNSIIITNSDEMRPNESSSVTADDSDAKSSREKPAKKASSKKKKRSEINAADLDTTCAVCEATFSSKNKLFLHLSKSGHSVYVGDKEKLLSKIREEDSEDSTNKRNKSKRNYKTK